TLHSSAASPNYDPGVQPGDQATYGQVYESWQTNSPALTVPPQIGVFVNVSSIGLTVESVSGTSVTEAYAVNYSNQTSITSLLTGDLATGSGSLDYWTITVDRSLGDHISGSDNSPAINITGSETIAGVLREFNGFQSELQLSNGVLEQS